MSKSPPNQDHHLCVLVHGLWGNPTHLDHIATTLRARHPTANLHILACKRNTGRNTYDGIETGGERVAKEIEEAIEAYSADGVEIKRISVVGYSLGGLVSRYAVGLLYSRGLFDRITPVNFTTFATPHLGVRTPLRGWHNHIWNVMGARTLSASGRQLFIIDKFRDSGRPLLSVLAERDSVFYKGLARFKNRVLYANIANDRSTSWYTAAISSIDPFANLSAVTVNFLPGYAPNLIDPRNPITLVPHPPSTPPRILTKLLHLTKLLLFALLLPLGALLYLLNALCQTLLSRRRIRLHTSSKSQHPYHTLPLLAEELQSAADTAMGDMIHGLTPEHLRDTDSSSGEDSDGAVLVKRPGSYVGGGAATSDLSDLGFPTLALANAQFRMIHNLDKLGFRKFPVWIHNDRHTHAAIILRLPVKRWEEGRVVVRHWVEEGFWL